MTQDEIKENNALIAEFMGFGEPDPFNLYNIPEDFRIITLRPTWTDLKFNYSYDWLMQVVDKISKLGCYDIRIHIYGSEADTFVDIIDDNERDNLEVVGIYNNFDTPLIESVYKSVVEFIKYYNQNK